MSIRAAAILLCVFLTMLSVAIARSSSKGMSEPDRIALIKGGMSAVERIESTTGELRVMISRGAQGEHWVVTRSIHDQHQSWPALERTRVNGFRILADQRLPVNTGSSPLPMPNDIRITAAGEAVALSIGSEPLAGRRPVVFTPADGEAVTTLLPEPVAGLLEATSLLGWRDMGVLPMLDAGVTEISYLNGDERVVLRRVGTRWGLLEPVVVPADPEAVRALLDMLSGLRFRSFADVFSEPADAAEIRVASRLDGDQIGWVVRIGLDGTVSSTIEGAGAHGPMRASGKVLSGDAQAGMLRVFHIASLISPITMDVPPNDVARITVVAGEDSMVFTRSGRSWDRDAPEVEAMLALLCVARADNSIVTHQGDILSAGPAVRMSVERFGGVPAAELSIRLEAGMIIVSNGSVDRVYARSVPQTELVAAWLESLATAPG